MAREERDLDHNCDFQKGHRKGKVYRGARYGAGDVDVIVVRGDRQTKLDPRNDLANHSPSGFEWGYGGSGPAQLALAILADVFGKRDERVMRLYQRFKFAYVAQLAQNEAWSITEQEVRDLVARLDTAA